MRTSRRLLLVASLVTALGGCRTRAKAEQAQAERDAQIETRAREIASKMAVEIEGRLRVDEAARRQAERAAARERLLRAPQDLFEVSGLKIVASGPDDEPHRPPRLHAITQLTVTNKASLPARDLVVRVDFFDESHRVATIPVRLHGTVPAGGTRTFSVADGTVEAAALEAPTTQTSATVVQASIDEPPGVEPPGLVL